jgi:hypothetical protein
MVLPSTPQPWAPGDRDVWLRIVPTTVTGRANSRRHRQLDDLPPLSVSRLTPISTGAAGRFCCPIAVTGPGQNADSALPVVASFRNG